jgi:hypothetical protein
VPATRSADTGRHAVTGSEFGAHAQPGAVAAQLSSGVHDGPAHHSGAVVHAVVVTERKYQHRNGFPPSRAAEPVADGYPATPAATEAGR